MFRQSVFLILFIGLQVYSVPAISAVSVVDDEKREVKLDKPAQSIISLAPHVTESLFAAGAGDKIIGAVSYSDYPEEAKKITRVGGYPSLDLEKIISLKPDLIIAWSSGNKKEQVQKLSDFGFKVFYSEPRYPLDIAKTIERFGVLAGTSDIAAESVKNFLAHYQSLKTRFANKEKVNVFYQIWNKPIMTINGEHLISEIIELCGGHNVFSGLTILTPRISLEAVLASKSEVIISGGMGSARPEWIEEWKPWPELPAVKNNQLYFIDPALMQRVGPRILDGADKLCDFLEQARKNKTH